MNSTRIAITGMSVNTVIGDELDLFLENLLDGKSAISKWTSIDTSKVYGKVGGDLGSYDIDAKVESYRDKIPAEIFARLRKLNARFPKLMGISLVGAVEAFVNAGLIHELDQYPNISTVIAGHNLNQGYTFENHEHFNEGPDFI